MTAQQSSAALKLGYNLGMFYIHYHQLWKLENDDFDFPERLESYMKDILPGAQTAAAGIVDALQELSGEPMLMQKILGPQLINNIHHVYAVGQLSGMARHPLSEDTASPIMHPNLLTVLGNMAAAIGREGFACFSDEVRDWLLEGYRLLREKPSRSKVNDVQ
jgi:hypothetical protein